MFQNNGFINHEEHEESMLFCNYSPYVRCFTANAVGAGHARDQNKHIASISRAWPDPIGVTAHSHSKMGRVVTLF